MNPKSKTCFSLNGEPLTEYPTEIAAREAALYINGQHGTNLWPSQCDRCKKWHLRPSGNSGKNNCSCVGANGKAKTLYQTEKAALRAAQHLQEENGVFLYTYRCPDKKGWHLTKRG